MSSFNKTRDLRKVSKSFSIRWGGRVLMLVMMVVFLSSASTDNSEVSRAEFITMISQNQPDHPFLPKSHENLSQDEFYDKTARILKV
ncbi:MAG: hypothetical protein F3745_04400, partial [Nitrospinae bacterium]|nr:hypothetical protein [Nitrospinota bacterium]